jgi:hypothetical protein
VKALTLPITANKNDLISSKNPNDGKNSSENKRRSAAGR